MMEIWTTNCIASYCEPGYIYDQEEKKCIKDICSSIQIPEEEKPDKFLYVKIFVPLCCLLTFAITIIIICRDKITTTAITMGKTEINVNKAGKCCSSDRRLNERSPN